LRASGAHQSSDLQADPPAETQRSNWLAAPKGDFSPFMRAYWPKPAVLDGSWTRRQLAA